VAIHTDAGRRDANKHRTRVAIETAAWRLFARDGFDHTTVDEIAAAADIAPRTFFRYFETKDAVLYGPWREQLADFCDRLRARPPDEAPLTALTAATNEGLEQLEDDTTELLQRARIISHSAHCGSYRYDVIQPASVEAIATVLAARLGVDPDLDLRPRLFAAVVTVALDTARDVWIAGGGRRPLARLVEQAFLELGAQTRSGSDWRDADHDP
jgi:AcrR family transcriptional regulator